MYRIRILDRAHLRWSKERNRGRKNFQSFFTSFSDFLLYLKASSCDPLSLEAEFLQNIIYHGTLFRYLGSSDPENTAIIYPQYNMIFSSWSKTPKDHYILSKLYGPVTQLSCNVIPPYFGIDLEGFTAFYHKYINPHLLIARPNEREVIFPTIKGLVFDINYLE